MTVLVTGATGFLGTYIIKELQEAGYTVAAFGRNTQVGEQLRRQGVRFISGDLTCYEDVLQACQGMEAVIHAGALSTLWGKWEDFYQTNVRGTEHVLKACQHHQVQRLVHISSPSIYAAPCHQLQIKETESPQTNSLNYYIKSKLLAEAKVTQSPHLPWVILRPRGLFGLGDTSLFPRILKMSQTRGIPLVEGGQQLVDMTCVENAALACRLAMEQAAAIHQIYNISNGEPYPFKDLLDWTLDALHLPKRYRAVNGQLLQGLARILEGVYKLFRISKEPPLTRYTSYLLCYSQTLDISKAQKELGYSPLIHIKEGIQRYAAENQPDKLL